MHYPLTATIDRPHKPQLTGCGFEQWDGRSRPAIKIADACAPVGPTAQRVTLFQISGDGTIFALQSDATKPLQPVILAAGGRWQLLAFQNTRVRPIGTLQSFLPRRWLGFEIAADVPRGEAERAQAADGEVGEVLTHAAAMLEHFDQWRGNGRRFGRMVSLFPGMAHGALGSRAGEPWPERDQHTRQRRV